MLNTSECGIVQVRGIVSISIPGGDNPSVNSCSVGLPEVHVDIRKDITCCGIHDLNVECQGNASLTICNVLSDQLACNVVGPLGCVRLKHTRSITGEKLGLRCVEGDAGQVGVVRRRKHCIDITSFKIRFAWKTAFGPNRICKGLTSLDTSLLHASTSQSR